MEDNVIYVGNKPLVVYAASVQAQVMQGKTEVHLKARGKAIGRAVDVSQLCVNKFLSGWEVAEVSVGTEEKEAEVESEGKKEKRNIRLSTIDIVLKKK